MVTENNEQSQKKPQKKRWWESDLGQSLGLSTLITTGILAIATFFKQHGPFEFTEKRPLDVVVKDTPKPTPPKVKYTAPDYSEALAQAKAELKAYLVDNIKWNIHNYYMQTAYKTAAEDLKNLTAEGMIRETIDQRSYTLKLEGRVVNPEEAKIMFADAIRSPEIQKILQELCEYLKKFPAGYSNLYDSSPSSENYRIELKLEHTIPVDPKTGKPTGPGEIKNTAEIKYSRATA
jgi:hypothetical protein